MLEWSSDADALIKKRYVEDDVSADVVAKEIGHGVTPSMVRSRAKRLNLKKVDAKPDKAPASPAAQARPDVHKARVYKVGPNAVTMADIAPIQCAWPVGPDPGEGNMHAQLFCGEPHAGDPDCRYCANHARIAWPKGR